MTQDIVIKLTVVETPKGIRMQGTFVSTDRSALAQLTERGLTEVLATLKRQVEQAHASARTGCRPAHHTAPEPSRN